MGHRLFYYILSIVFGVFIGGNIKISFNNSAHAALNEAACAAAVVAEIKANNPATVEARVNPQWAAICKGIIAHIKSAAVVSTVVTGSSASGGPVTATGVGTIQ